MRINFLKLIARKIRQAIAIVEESDTCTHTGGIAVGKYVLWKGNLYKVTTAIANGETISVSKLSAVDDGIANDLNSKIASLLKIKTETITSDENGFFDTSLKADEALIIDVISISGFSGPYKVSILRQSGPNVDLISLQFLEWNDNIIFKSTTKTITFIYIDLPTS